MLARHRVQGDTRIRSCVLVNPLPLICPTLSRNLARAFKLRVRQFRDLFGSMIFSLTSRGRTDWHARSHTLSTVRLLPVAKRVWRRIQGAETARAWFSWRCRSPQSPAARLLRKVGNSFNHRVEAFEGWRRSIAGAFDEAVSVLL